MRSIPLWCSTLTFVLGCMGTLDPTPRGGARPVEGPPAYMTPDRVPLRPLTPAELDFALQDLVGDDAHLALRLQPSLVRSGAETLASPDFSWTGARSDLLVATMYDVAVSAVRRDPMLLACSTASGDACIEAQLGALGARAMRRPVTPTELTRYLDVVHATEAMLGRSEAIARALQALLLSPDFLYLTTIGTPAGTEISGEELASRLAFFLWASLPDDALLAAARRGDLSNEMLRGEQVRRLLADPRSGRAMSRFVLGWTQALELGNHAKADPIWTGALVGDAVRETDAFVQDWFRDDDAGFLELFSADHTFATPRLAALYGLTVPAGTAPDAVVRIEGTRARGRVGLLTQASFLATHSHDLGTSPVNRGYWVETRALCQPVGAAPMDAQARAPMRTPMMTTREWNEEIARTPGCESCHNRMAPPGFLLERFDAIGRIRADEGGRAIDTRATIRSRTDLDGTYADATELSQAMGESQRVRQCFSRQWVQYALGRPASERDALLIHEVHHDLETSVQNAAFRIAMSEAFRRAKAPEFVVPAAP